MAIPNIFVGGYLIVKQQLFVSKYNSVINKLVAADDAKKKMETEQKKQANGSSTTNKVVEEVKPQEQVVVEEPKAVVEIEKAPVKTNPTKKSKKIQQ